MGDLGLDAIFAALTNADKQSREDSPFNPFEALATDVGQSIYKDAPHYSTAENLIGGLLTGLVGGGSKQLTNRYVADQDAIARDIIIGSMTGNRIDRPSSMAPSIYSTLDNAGSIYTLGEKLNSASAAAEDQRKFDQELALERMKQMGAAGIEELKQGYGQKNEVLKAKIANPYQARKIDEVLYGKPTDAAAPAAPSSIDMSFPIIGDQSLKRAPMIEDYMDRAQGNPSVAKSMMDFDLAAPERLMSLRKEFSSKPEVQDYILADTGFRAMQKAYADTKGTSDVELTRRAIQAIEPGLAVRTDDQQAIAASSSIPDEWKSFMLGALTGGSKLPDDVRAGLMRIAQRGYNERAANFNKTQSFYKQQAANSNLDPEGVTYLEAATPNQDTFGSTIISTPDGKRWQQQGDKYIEVP